MKSVTILVCLSVSASAQSIYTWEDRSGSHFTDDPALIPLKFRTKAQAMKSLGAAPLTETGTSISPAVPQSAEAANKQNQDERDWRSRFVGAMRRIESLKASIESLTRTLPPRVDCVGQPLIPVGNVTINGAPSPVLTAPGAQVVTVNGVTTVVAGSPLAFGVPPAVCRVNELHDRQQARIAEETVALAEARNDLESLDREASLRGIPREWRRGW